MRKCAIGYFADMVVCPLLAAALSIYALTRLSRSAVVEWSLLVTIGAGLWTLVEYGMHRVAYHRIPIFARYHEVHHADPHAFVGAPPMLGTSLVFLISFVPIVFFSPVLANAISVGMLAGYTIYMIVHHACHFGTPSPGGYLYRVRLHHAVHHYRNDNGNFGVTTSFWDRVFATRIQPSMRLDRPPSEATQFTFGS